MCERAVDIGVENALEWAARHCVVGAMAVGKGNLTLAKHTLKAAHHSIGRALDMLGDVMDSKTGMPDGVARPDVSEG